MKSIIILCLLLLVLLAESKRTSSSSSFKAFYASAVKKTSKIVFKFGERPPTSRAINAWAQWCKVANKKCSGGHILSVWSKKKCYYAKNLCMKNGGVEGIRSMGQYH
jgi:hypothetical protein